MSFLNELKRRNVFRVAVAYVVLTWVVLQVSDVLFDALELPALWNKTVLAVLALGFIPTLVFSWVYEMTPEGVKRESEIDHDKSITPQTAKKLNLAVILLLSVAILMFAADRYIKPPATSPEGASTPALTTAPDAGVNEVPVVAVLPFQALSTEDEGVFLAAGLHDDLLTRLAGLQAFRVISRTSVMAYANTTKNMRQIGEELGAGFILEGGLQAIGGRVRINAQLIKASTDEHLWANTFNEELTTANLFEVQADIASSIADAMHATLNPSDLASMEDVPTDNLDAYRAFLKGQEAFGGLTRTSLRVSAESFREAVELDPLFAEAWAALSNSLSARYWEEGGEWDATPDVSLLNAAKQALEQAQELDPDGLDTLIAEAYYLYYGFRDYSSALIVLGRAQASAPHHENVISLRGFLLRRLGRLSEAADALLLAYGNSLNNANSLREIIITLRIAGRCDEANAFATLALEQHPNNEGVLGVSAEVLLICNKNIPGSRSLAERINISTMQHLEWVIQALVFAGDFQAAIKVLTFDPYGIGDNPTNRLTIANQLTWLYREIGQQALAETSLRTAVAAAENITETSAIDLVELAWTEALRGNVKSCLEYGARTLASLPNDAFLQPVFRYKLAIAFAQAGATDAALEQLRIMLGEPRGRQLTLLLKDPYLASLREHPEFQALVTDDA